MRQNMKQITLLDINLAKILCLMNITLHFENHFIIDYTNVAEDLLSSKCNE